MPNYYEILGVPRDATPDEIRKAYISLVRRLHPDRNRLPGETELFLEVQKAYEVLSNAERRAAYDATLPPEAPSSPFRLNTFYSRNALLKMEEIQLLYMLCELEVASGEKRRGNWNISLVVDRSTSMQGEKLETVKTAILEWMNAFTPEDLYSIIAFSDRAEVVVPSSLQRSAQQARSRIYAIHAAGGTEIYQGLEAAYEQILRGYAPERLNHIVLLTDGHTYGDEQACLQLAEQAAEKGILISAIGLGSDWNDTFLDRLTSHTGGSAHFASSAEDVVRLLKHLFQQLQQTYAENVLFDFTLSQGVEISYIFRIHPQTSPLIPESPLHLGSLLNDEPLSWLMELRVMPRALQGEMVKLLEGTIRITPIGAYTSFQLPLRVTRPITQEADASPPPTNLVQALSRLTLYRLQEQAQQQAQSGNYAHATRTLHYLASHLVGQGERSLARTVLLEAERLQREGKLSEEGKKTIKYGTRALISPPRKEGEKP
ncbi:MAG: DnaJ domain-containing protein [Anaerolineales bacterium]